MAILTTDTSWTETLSEGSYDIQKRGFGDIYIGRGTVAPTSVKETMLIEDRKPFRLKIAAGDSAYFYGDDVEVYYYIVE